MIKILHTADWHLGKWLDNFPRLPEQKEVLQEICDIAERENIDVVLIAGDLYDTFNPSAEAQDLFYKTVKRLADNGKRAVIAIAGNHDQPERIEAADHLARECGIIFIGYPNSKVSACDNEGGLCISNSEEGFIEVKLKQCEVPVRIIATPYANEFRLKTYLGNENSEEELRNLLQHKWQQLADKYCDQNGINLLCAHLFFQKKGEAPQEEPDDEKPILHVGGAQAIYSENIPSQIQYAALGHLHRYQVIDKDPCPVVYSSSPLSYSFSEADQDKYIVIVEADKGQPVNYRKEKLTKGKRLIRQRFENIDEAVVWLTANPDILVELTIVADEFLSAKDRKRLTDTHEGIISVIPEIRNRGFVLDKQGSIDLNRSMEDLFKDYFNYAKGQEANSDILSLFKEVLGTEDVN